MIIMKTKCKPKNIGEILSESDITSDGELRTTYTSEFPNWNKSFDEIGKELGECLESYNTPTEKSRIHYCCCRRTKQNSNHICW